MAEKIVKKKKRSQWSEIWRRLSKNKGAIVGMVITITLVVLACSADIIYDYKEDVISQHISQRYQLPSAEHWFGTDYLGRDVFNRVVYGTRYSLVIGFASTIMSTIIGMIVGSIVGYFGGKLDIIVMRLCDVLGAIPGMLMGLIIVSVMGPSFFNLIVALGISAIPNMTRVTRAAVMTVRNSEYVESARSIAMPEWKIILKYIIPNCMSPIIVAVTLRVGSAIIGAASFSFLGLGIQPPAPEWGTMLAEGRADIRYYPYLTLFPGLAIMLTVLALNLFGDGLRDAMDPKLRK